MPSSDKTSLGRTVGLHLIWINFIQITGICTTDAAFYNRCAETAFLSISLISHRVPALSSLLLYFSSSHLHQFHHHCVRLCRSHCTLINQVHSAAWLTCDLTHVFYKNTRLSDQHESDRTKNRTLELKNQPINYVTPWVLSVGAHTCSRTVYYVVPGRCPEKLKNLLDTDWLPPPFTWLVRRNR